MADLRILHTEEMVGVGHPTKIDTLNRFMTVEHNNDGTHKAITQVTDPYVDVRAFGAVGDGVTDDTAAVQAAIDAVSASGGTVYFPVGVYMVNNLSWSNKFVHLLGSGTGFQSDDVGTVLKKNTNGDLLTISASDDKGFIIERLKIEGDKGTYTGKGISVTDVRGWQIRDTIIRNCAGNALSVSSCGWHRLFNVFCSDCDDHIIQYTGNGDWMWYGVEADTVGVVDKDAVNIVTSNGVIYGGHFESGVTYGRHGILISDSRVNVIGAWVGFCGDRGIHIYASTADSTSDERIISNCRLYNNGQRATTNASGISIASNVSDCLIIGNQIEDLNPYSTGIKMKYGIWCAGDGNRFIGNSIRNFLTNGIAFTSGADNNHTAFNSIDEDGGGGTPVADNGSGNKFWMNTGFITENNGTDTITSGTTSKIVAHGLSATPTFISVNFSEQGTNDYGRWWLSAVGGTNFTLNVSADPGASNLDFGWEAKRR